jgi:hypothetical protein
MFCLKGLLLALLSVACEHPTFEPSEDHSRFRGIELPVSGILAYIEDVEPAARSHASFHLPCHLPAFYFILP